MIIYFNKTSGEIVGTTDGRIHDENHLNMWIGSKEDNDRIVIQWEPVAFYDKDGRQIKAGSKKAFTADFSPRFPQKDLIVAIEKGEENILDYKVDPKTETLVKK